MAETQTGAQAPRFKIFISYSRADMAFADRLVAAMKQRDFEVQIDRQNLPTLEDWERELLSLIRQSDTIVFIVSPHSLTSKSCAWEVEQVRKNAKRMAPVVIADVQGVAIPEEISKINYLFFTDEAQFEKNADELERALHTDLGWLKEHTRFGELARRWIERGHPDDALIRGGDLSTAIDWLGRQPRTAPAPTDAIRAFLNASRLGEANRLMRQRRLQRRAAWALAWVALLVLGGLVGVLVTIRHISEREARIFASKAAAALQLGYYDRALRYALAGVPAHGLPSCLRGRKSSKPGWQRRPTATASCCR
jgi:hypothetical protein